MKGPVATDCPMETVDCALCGTADQRTWANLGDYTIVECTRCGLRWVNPRPMHPRADDTYDEGYYKAFYEGKDASKREYFSRRVLELVPMVPDRPRLLDVGAGTGIFLEVAQAQGWQVEGVDPSAAACRVCRETLGVEVWHGTIEDLSPSDSRYDVITMWEVLEHTRDPLGTLHAAQELLVDGGLLALSVPNASGLVGVLRWREELMPWYHLYHFTQSTLKALLRRAGFLPVRLRTIQVHGITHTVSTALEQDEYIPYIPAPVRACASAWLSVHRVPGLRLLTRAALAVLHRGDRVLLWARKPARTAPEANAECE